MYQLTPFPSVVIDTRTGTAIPRGHRLWDEYEAWLAKGNAPKPLPPPYEPNTPEHYRAIRDAAWQWMTAEVQSRRYDSIESCCSYANSTVPRYKGEALAMVAWRDAVNVALETLVASPPAGLETWEQVRALLPQPEQFAWPAEVDIPLGTGESAQLD